MSLKNALTAIWRTICYPLLLFAVQFIVGAAWGMAIGIGVGVVAAQEGRTPSVEEIELAVVSGMNLPLILLIGSSISLFIIWLLLRKEWKGIGFWSGTSLTALTIFLCFLIGIPLNRFIGGAIYFTQLTELFPFHEELMEALFQGNIIVQILATVLLAPILEEVVFRGTILRRLKDTSVKFHGANIIQALLFALIHGNVLQGIYAFLLGIILGFLYVKFNSIWAPIAMHIGFNAFGALIANIPIYEDVEASNTATLIVTLVSLGLSIILWLIIQKRNDYADSPEIINPENISITEA